MSGRATNQGWVLVHESTGKDPLISKSDPGLGTQASHPRDTANYGVEGRKFFMLGSRGLD